MTSKMKVVKRNGKHEDVSFDKILYRIKKLITDKKLGEIENVHADVITKQVISNIYDGVTTQELDNLTARIAIEKSTKEHANYEILATRVAVSNMHKQTTECFSSVMEKLYNNVDSHGEHSPLISEEIFNVIKKHKKRLNLCLDYDRDYSFSYIGLKTLEKSYLLKIKGEIIERPQHMWMRVSVGLHKGDIEKVIETYDLMSTGYFIHATPTLFNAGTPRPNMASCFLMGIEDSMEGIYKCLSDCAIISKNAGGIGIAITDVRSEGSYIRGTNGYADGIVKPLRVFNETARYANQGNKRNGSIAFYIEPWHSDILQLLQIRTNTGDENLKCRDLFTALWIPDLFMEKVEKGEDWYLMSPSESVGLTDVYGEEFNKLYNKYVEEGRYVKKINARDLFEEITITQIETGMPYVSYKDHANRKSNQKNIGTIKGSNLCVSGDTRILTDKGYYPIKTLVDKEVSVWNGKEWSSVVPRKTGENQNLLKVVLNNGKWLRCTDYHKFFVINDRGEVRKIKANDLKEGDRLLDCYNYPVVDYNKNNEKYTSSRKLADIIPPLNYDIITKIKWLEIMVLLCGRVENNTIILELTSFYSAYKNKLKEIQLTLDTLGAPCFVSTTTSYFLWHKHTITIPQNSVYNLIKLKFKHPHLDVDMMAKTKMNLYVTKIIEDGTREDTFCFREGIRGMGVFDGILTGNCDEILIVSDTKEYGTCNISTVGLAKYIEKDSLGNPTYNFNKLYDVVRVMVRNMNNVIDYNYYPVVETKRSNNRHRPIAIGAQGLANAFFEMRYPFESKEAKDLNKKIFETIQYACLYESKELAKIHGPYETFKGSPASKGLFQHNLWGIEDSELSGLWDWETLRKEVMEHGLRNSLLTACPPTASTGQILGNYESFEPVTNNMFTRSILAGSYPVINKYLVEDLTKIGVWSAQVYESIASNRGSVQHLDIPQELKDLYKTVWEIPQKTLMELSADRGAFVDHSQSLNLYFKDPTPNKLKSAHFYGWKLGLKTSMYYCRTPPKSEAQQFTVSPNVQPTPEQILQCSIDNPESCEMCSG